MINQIKELRIKIDGLAQLTENLNTIKVAIIAGYKNSKETEKAYDSLIFAKAWLGKLLGELEVESPYSKDGTRKTVDDIEPAADIHRGIKHLEEKGNWNTDFNHIEKVDWLRQEIEKITEEVSKWYTHTKAPTREFSIARTNAYNYLYEARMWFGFELGRLRDESKK